MEKLELSKKYTSCHKTWEKKTLCSSQARNTKSFFPCFVARNILTSNCADEINRLEQRKVWVNLSNKARQVDGFKIFQNMLSTII